MNNSHFTVLQLNIFLPVLWLSSSSWVILGVVYCFLERGNLEERGHLCFLGAFSR